MTTEWLRGHAKGYSEGVSTGVAMQRQADARIAETGAADGELTYDEDELCRRIAAAIRASADREE